MKINLFCFLFLPGILLAQNNIPLKLLAKDFFAFRTIEQPITSDDINRVERPDGWVPDFSAKAIAGYNQKYRVFKQRLNNLDKSKFTLHDSVDYLLLHSAIERINWELNVLKLPEKDPDFYAQQTLGAVFDLLVISSPINETRAKNIILRLNSIPATIKNAEENLTEPVSAFAEIALEEIGNVKENLDKMESALQKIFPESLKNPLEKSVKKASEALTSYKSWIKKRIPAMSNNYSVGRKGYEYFLKNVALIPYTPEEILSMGHMEFNRAVAFDVDETLRDKGIPKPKIFSNIEEQLAAEKKDEEAIRKFLIEKNIMSVPQWIKHYLNEKTPDYVAPLTDVGETDDFTSPTRLNENAVRYIPAPSPKLPFFLKASAEDPRPIIVHEGVPGHYFQLVRSWANIDPVRRHFFDSGANEGIAFYLEELMQQFGLFDNKPHTREIIYRFMRLRALRVDVDVNLALGNYKIKDAAKYLAATVPMDSASAVHEAGFFALTPGQGISYQIGKLQILKLISDAKILLGDKFSLKNYHDYMLDNGNIPIALQRWEYLGLNDQIKKLWPN
jgi:uncharacterized protein (DUF885 family)